MSVGSRSPSCRAWSCTRHLGPHERRLKIAELSRLVMHAAFGARPDVFARSILERAGERLSALVLDLRVVHELKPATNGARLERRHVVLPPVPIPRARKHANQMGRVSGPGPSHQPA
ncbi:hypothetical protein PCASD_03678 [Puccinia coronata f. sp. avenae]|uniref:Uncharacterized protein n=1 Tax=Puccinia coronata f. sp. avenae TaxID=200324 RepID=A0A2N5V9Q6_9BASI|nr:hypothetical protein PCASD_03678 [Puccinia coronata f. sp. avenae]